MISMRIKKFYKKTGRNLQFDAKEPVGFDKTKVECFNCHKTGHFARECRTKEDNRRRDGWNPGNKDRSRTGKKEESKALVTVDGESVDWTTHSEDDENYAFMASNSSGSDTQVNSCSNECKESYANLKRLYDAQREELSDASVEIKAYTQDLDDKTDVLTYHKKLLAKAQKEKDDLEVIVDKWNHSSKNLGKIVNSHMSARDKFGLGYGDYRYSGILSYENEVLQSVFKGNKSDFENLPLHKRLGKTGEMQAVPPPMTGNYLPSGPDIEIDDSQYTYGPGKTQPSESESQTTELDTCDSNISTEPSELVSEPVVNESNIEVQPKIWSDALIIEEYESDSDDECMTVKTKGLDTPSFANKQVKTPRENVKNQSTHSQKPKGLKIELGHGFMKGGMFCLVMIVTEPIQRKAPGNVGNTGVRGKKVICYNCRGEGHVARQCKEQKRKMDSQYFKDKALLMEAKEKGDVLDAEAEAFLADVECTAPYDQPQALTTTNMFQANHEDAYDSDVDEGPNAAVAFMANLSSTSATNSQVNEVHSNDNPIFDNVDYQLNQEMHQEEHLDSDAETEIDDNTIPYHQYLLDTEAQNVPTEVSADTSDKVSMIAILTDLQTQLDGHAKVNQEKCLEVETLKNELSQCKQEIYRLDTQKVKLDLENKVRQEQALANTHSRTANTEKLSALTAENTKAESPSDWSKTPSEPAKTVLKRAPRINEFLSLRLRLNNVCATCNKSLAFANHSDCLVMCDGSVNVKPHQTKRFKRQPRKEWKPVKKVWKPISKPVANTSLSWNPLKAFLIFEKYSLTRIMEPTDMPIRNYPRVQKGSLVVQIVLWYLDSGCSRHMTGDRARLINFVEKFIGTVRFGNDEYAAIIGYGDYKLGDTIISRVYYVEGLKHNLFSVGQFCDGGLEVAFRQHSCHIRNYDMVDLLKGSRTTNLYSISLNDMMSASPVCLLTKASSTKSWLWHRRLNHLNFGTLNELARNNLVRGKSKKASHPLKTENTNTEVLHTLHMDLCGPMRTESINGKKYVLVIVDDYTRMVGRFLRSKDETPQVIEKFIVKTQRALNATVRFVRTDNGTETALSKDGTELLWKLLVLSMLILSKAPPVLMGCQLATACYTLNRSLVHTLHGKTYYELLKGKKPNLQYFRVFGSLCYPTNDYDDVGKLKAKADIGIFVGYAPTKKAYRIYNKRTRKIQETVHVAFDELTEGLTSVQTSSGLAPQQMTSVQNSTELELTALQSGRSRSALVKDPEPPSVPPTKKQVDDLFQWFDDDEVVLRNLRFCSDNSVNVSCCQPSTQNANGSPSTTVISEGAPAVTENLLASSIP
ncbi:retrovirus-related pol polyprotein from transposon TNT 1-94 [Tanacetum coccineum]